MSDPITSVENSEKLNEAGFNPHALLFQSAYSSVKVARNPAMHRGNESDR